MNLEKNLKFLIKIKIVIQRYKNFEMKKNFYL